MSGPATDVAPICETIMSWGPICGDPAPTTVTVGCVHEHFETGPICDYHLGRLEDRTISCPACWRGPDSHMCVMLGRVVVVP